MSRLGITFPLQEDQSLASFCSQLASANGASNAREFCLHMGLRFQEVVDGTAESINHLSNLSGVAASLLSEAATIKHNGLYLMNGEKLTKPFLCRSRLKYCPLCLVTDNEREDRLPQARQYGRKQWLVSFIRTCPIHDVELASLNNHAGPSGLHDFTILMDKENPDLNAAFAGLQKRNHSHFERYIAGRLANGAVLSAFLDSLPLYAAGRACEILGAIVEKGPKVQSTSITDAEWWTYAESGFKVMSNGEGSIRDCLTTFHDRLHAFG